MDKQSLRSSSSNSTAGLQTVILVDEKDKFLGYASREECHTGKGKRHRAFVTLLFDGKGRVSLQRRKHKLFDNLWDFTAISHNLHLKGHDESYQEASNRALNKELGIKHVDVRKVGGFDYTAKHGKDSENEYCAVLVGKWDEKVIPNKDEVYEVKWVDFDEFIKDIKKNPKKYTVWARKAAKIVHSSQFTVDSRQNEFFGDWGRFRKEFEKYYTEYFKTRTKEAKNYPGLVIRCYKELADFGAGGKRLRPYLCWLGYRLGKSGSRVKSLEKILPVCLAVELAHLGFMIHDDVIDKSDTRHGKPTMHKRFDRTSLSSRASRGEHYGISQAIVLGDLAIFEAFKLLEEAGLDVKFGETFVETCLGQGLDVEFGFKRPRFDEVMQVIDLKTARYTFVGPLVAGFMAGKGPSYAKATGGKKVGGGLEKFALACGRAYQLRDDILGVFGNEKVLGKSVLSDMREGKNTVLIFKALEMSGQKERQSISQIWGKRDAGVEEVRQIREIIRTSGALEWCEEELESLVREAGKRIESITTDDSIRKILRQLAGFAAEREF